MFDTHETIVPIAILDFGSQFTHLISRRLRDAKIYCEIFPPTISVDELRTKQVQGIILSGSPASVYEEDAPAFNEDILQMNVPVLGICYGYHLMLKLLGGKIVPHETKEFGGAELQLIGNSALFKDVQGSQKIWMSHGDSVVALPSGFVKVGITEDGIYAAAENTAAQRYGIQFHPEVAHTEHGQTILANFAVGICHCTPSWDMGTYLERAEQYIRRIVGNRNVFLLVSGGIDSVTVFLLLNRALGQARVKGLFINTGLLRPGDTAMVHQIFGDWGIENYLTMDASHEFITALQNVSDPEQKRNIIGQKFLDAKDRCMLDLGLETEHWVLAQGTIYPDIITSGGSTHARVIKTHHNSLPSLQNIEVLEPLRYLYKDEVRKLAHELGLPHNFIWKHPFPGPGIGVRIAGAITEQKITLYHKVDEIVLRHLRTSGWYEKLWMGFPILVDMQEVAEPTIELPSDIIADAHRIVSSRLEENHIPYDEIHVSVLPIRSVGVKGDYRSYEHPIELRITHRGIRCHIPHHLTERISRELTNRIQGINRVLLGLTWSGEEPLVWRNVIVLRMLLSIDTLTADWAKLEHDLLDTIATEIATIPEGIDAIYLDVTQKPPSTMEWE